MKKIVLGFSLLICLNAMSQDVPKNIEVAFKKLYPSAVDTEWITYSKTYVSEFMVKDAYKTASFDKSGNWIQTSTSIEEASLPAAVKTFINNKFGDAAFDSVELIESKSLKYYNIVVMDEEGETSNVALDATGKIVKLVQEIEEDEESEEEDEE